MRALFDLLHPDTFLPLASPNRKVYWDVLVMLYKRFFGEDAEFFTDIEDRQLRIALDDYFEDLSIRDWHAEVEPETEIGQVDLDGARLVSYRVYRRLIKTGWLEEERAGLERVNIFMPMPMNSLLKSMIGITGNDALTIGGEILRIQAVISATMDDPYTRASSVRVACSDARNFVHSLRNMGAGIKRISELTRTNLPSRVILKTFFEDFVQNMLATDYKEVKTKHHPMIYRKEIIQNVNSLLLNANRFQELSRGYKDSLNLTEDESKLQAERDLYTLINIFESIPGILEDIDRKKLALERKVSDAMRMIGRMTPGLAKKAKDVAKQLGEIEHDECVFEFPIIQNTQICDEALMSPRKARPELEPEIAKRRSLSPYETAKKLAIHEFNQRRQVSSDALISYIERHMSSSNKISTDDLHIESVQDYICFVRLRVLMRPNKLVPPNLKELIKYFHITPSIDESITSNDHVECSRLNITRIKQRRQ